MEVITTLSGDFSSYAEGSGITSTGNIGDYPGSVTKWVLDVSSASLTATTDWINRCRR